jgi:EmrB/QacA subfamily drug resistance transporter
MEPIIDSNHNSAPNEYPPGSPNGVVHKWWVLIAIGIGTFMSALDGSVVNTILPVVRTALKSDVAAVEWVVTIYLLVLSGLLLSFGRLGDIQGHKNAYLTGFAVFLVCSALCGLAPSVPFLVVVRAIQALGAAMLSANSPAILTKSFPASQRGQALGLQATMTYLGLTVGPSLGGWLTDAFGWRTVFYINLPVGLVAFLLSYRFVVADRPKKILERFDITGALLFIAGLTALLLGLNQGHAWGWGSPFILGLLLSAVVLMTIFIYVEKRSVNPMLDMSLFTNRIFSTSVLSAVLNYICVYSVMFLMPFYLLQGRGLTTAIAGTILTAEPIIMAIIAPISGTLSDRFGTRFLGVIGMVFLAIGLGLLSLLGPSAPYSQVVLALAVTGFGIGVFISPNNSALMGAASQSRQGIAAGILATARNLGMVLGVGLSGAIFTTLLGPENAPTGHTLYEATRASFLVGVGVAIIGIIITAIRPGRADPNKNSPEQENGYAQY